MLSTRLKQANIWFIVLLLCCLCLGNSGCKTKSADASLASLVISLGTLDPAFSPDTLEYDVIFSSFPRSVLITAMVNHTQATMTINDVQVIPGIAHQVNTPTPDGKIRIIVIAEDGATTRTYVLTLVEVD